MYVIDKIWNSAAENLAYEFCLMNEVARRTSGIEILYLWQNKDTVVIGRNQNPYKECNITFIKKSNIELVRRLTGGGAVYHDLGNLNYSFICREKYYDKKEVFKYIIDALYSLGITCELNGRNDIVVGTRKISGNAFYRWNGVVLHHGTILIDVNIGRMEKCLTPCKIKLNSKGVNSVKSRVSNLVDIKKDIDIGQVKKAIICKTGKCAKGIDNVISIDETLFESTKKKFLSKKWIYGLYPLEYETIAENFKWGSVVLGLALKGNYIENCYIESDGLYPDVIENLERYLNGLDLSNLYVIKNRVICNWKNNNEKQMINDILSLIDKKHLSSMAIE